MAAPTVIMRPIIDWYGFVPTGVSYANMNNEMAYVFGGKHGGTIKGQRWTAAGQPIVSYTSLGSTLVSSKNMQDVSSQLFVSNSANTLVIGALGPSTTTTLYLYIQITDPVAMGTVEAYHATLAGDTPDQSGVTLTTIFSESFNDIRYVVYKIVKDSAKDYVFIKINQTNATSDMTLNNVRLFDPADAYEFDLANDKIVWGENGGHGQAWTWLASNVPITPFSGSELLYPYFYDQSIDQLLEMHNGQPVQPVNNNNHGYSIICQFDGEHYGTVGINLWDDATMSDRVSKVFSENVIGMWGPGTIDGVAASHTRAKIQGDNGYGVRLAADTALDKSYVIGLLAELWYNNTEINPVAVGQESPVIDLDYSYI